jgi:leucyl-tRNA synthetase
MVLKGGTAMSKSKGNIVDPDEMVRRYGADTTRLFTLFAAPPEKDLEWNEAGVEGCFRFLDRVWRLFAPRAAALAAEGDPAAADGIEDARRSALRRKVHQTIARITVDLDRRLHLNTPVAALMELTNAVQDFERAARPGDGPYLKEAGRAMALLLQPFAPHVSEELWSLLGGTAAASATPWPEPIPAWLQEDDVEIVVQVNGRVRARLRVPSSATESEVLALARAEAHVAAHTEGRTIRRTVFVPGRLLNLVL